MLFFFARLWYTAGKERENMAWSLEEAISYYRKQGAPRDQSALVALLKEPTKCRPSADNQPNALQTESIIIGFAIKL